MARYDRYGGAMNGNPGAGYGDLWKWDVTTRWWVWMHGTSGSPSAVVPSIGVEVCHHSPLLVSFRFFSCTITIWHDPWSMLIEYD